MKGFTLTEVMISLLLGLITMLGFARYSMAASKGFQEDRIRMGVMGNLRMAHKELQDLLQGVDREFFEKFPIVQDNLTHAMSENLDGIQVGLSCPEDEDSMCLMVWDVKPGPEPPIIYNLNDWDWPRRVSISPVEMGSLPGPGEEIEAMSVLLFISEEQEFCALVERAETWELYLADVKDQPWELPETLIGKFEVIHLGPLRVNHLSLKPEPQYGKKLVYTPLSLDENGWHVGRSHSSYGYLFALQWLPANNLHPHRLLVLGRSRKPPALDPPIEIGGKIYDREVHHVSIEF